MGLEQGQEAQQPRGGLEHRPSVPLFFPAALARCGPWGLTGFAPLRGAGVPYPPFHRSSPSYRWEVPPEAPPQTPRLKRRRG
ncbi:hypothetical protein GCM10010302_71270 [Streptomyces polychromogenes]|uniref:Uncharacterized protein n=1 Tax=Streptomyces polychromogenes TaxID=67342 RepID=A0ABP3FS48_9ACTN